MLLAHVLLFALALHARVSAPRAAAVAVQGPGVRLVQVVSVSGSSIPLRADPVVAAASAAEPATKPTTKAAASSPGASPAAQGRPAAPTSTGVAPEVVFHAPAELLVQPRPRSAPDTRMVEGLSWSGVPLRLRLFIDARGVVVDAVILASVDDPEVNGLVRQMFVDTRFVPGRIGTEDVASYKDIEISVGPGR